MRIKPGDVVALKSGGPNMTVVSIVEPDPQRNNFKHPLAECQWMNDEGNVKSWTFDLRCLTLTPPKENNPPDADVTAQKKQPPP